MDYLFVPFLIVGGLFGACGAMLGGFAVIGSLLAIGDSAVSGKLETDELKIVFRLFVGSLAALPIATLFFAIGIWLHSVYPFVKG